MPEEKKPTYSVDFDRTSIEKVEIFHRGKKVGEVR